MTLPASGNSISLNQVNVELGNSGTAAINMNSADVRGLFGVASGAIAMSDGFGKALAVWYGSRGIFIGGEPRPINVIDYITIANTGNATDFGNTTSALSNSAALSDGSRGVIGGGYDDDGSSPYNIDVIQYVTIANTGNATDFGNLTQARKFLGAASNGSRGVFAGGGQSPSHNIMDYVTIANTGNATDFGDLLSAVEHVAGCSNGSRGIFAIGSSNGGVIQYITIANTGNATDFGNLAGAETRVSSCSSSAGRGIFSGGNASGFTNNNSNRIQYITIASTGNATDFGDLATAAYYFGSASDGSRGVMGGGSGGGNVIQYITIANTGNATDFGDLTVSRSDLSATSGT